ncbi:MAG: M3 family metallopeptidase [Bdellovibrionales bacterium]
MNPILHPSTLPHGAVPFDQIRPEHFMPALDQALEHGRTRLEKLKGAPASFNDTFEGLEHASEEVEFVNLLFSNLLVAHSNPEMEKLSMEIGPKVAAFANDILLDPVVFEKIKSVYEKREASGLSDTQKYFVEKVYRDFTRSGAGLPEESKNRLRAIDERLSQLVPKFRENVLHCTNEFEMWIDNESDLAGLPPTARTAAKEAARAKGQENKWLITLQMPSYVAFVRFSEKREMREKIYRAMSSRAFGGAHDNSPVLLETVRLMDEKAKLLGASNFAEWALETRMAETPDKVQSFLDKILRAAKPAAEKDLAEVQDLATQMGGPNPLQAWDFLYYSEKLKEKKYSFDEESLRPYFQLERVLDGVFELARRLFGLQFQQRTGLPVYHSDVRVFEVTREKGGEFVGLFYADFFPRESKSQGAWMTNFYEQGPFRGHIRRPHVSIVCNFTKPTPENPSLLNFDEVTTLFHEFGHALHSLLSQVEYRTISGTNVYLDFVELPSQFLENWAEEEEFLRVFAKHYKTGADLPETLLRSLKQSQKFLTGYQSMRQLQFGFLDLNWYRNPPDDQNASVAEFEKKAVAPTLVLPPVEGTNISTSFVHIFGGGYAAGYYSYKWAEALDADAFEYFVEKGIFNRDLAREFEQNILAKGGSDHPMRLYEKFRGRQPDPTALLRRDGLIDK